MRAAAATASSTEKCVGCRRIAAPDNDHVESLEQRVRFLGNRRAIGEVREPSHPIPQDGALAVQDGHGHDLLPTQAERPRHGRQHHSRQPAPDVGRRFERVGERARQIRHGARVAKGGNRLVRQVVESPQFVEAEHVVGVL